MNNPLSATDPTGYFSFKSVFKSLFQIALGIALGPAAWYIQAAMMGFASYAMSSGDARAGLVAAATAGMFHAVGTAFGPAPQNYLLSGYHMGKVLSHGIVGGISAKLGGGNFADGFRSAAVTQAFAPGIDRIGDGSVSVAARASRITVAAVVGGTASAAGGGKFANGAVTGAFSRAFNDESHHQQAKRWNALADEFQLSLKTAYELGSVGDQETFEALVATGGAWDYKNRHEYSDLPGVADFGNFAAGATAAAWAHGAVGSWWLDYEWTFQAGMNVVLRYAGWYQEHRQSKYDPQNGSWYNFGPPATNNYGDYPRDGAYIINGGEWYRSHRVAE